MPVHWPGEGSAARTASQPLYRAFLRSRWPSRTHKLAIHAFLGSLLFVALDWVFTRQQAEPPSLGTLAALRLPWTLLPLAGFALSRWAPAWRFLPGAVVTLSVVWAWAAALGYYPIGLGGSIIQAITLFACLVTVAAILPLTLPGRAGVFAVISLGFVAFDLQWPHPVPLAARVADDLAVLGFAVIQVVVFQAFATSQRRGLIYRRKLEATVEDLAASRERAALAVAEVGRLAAEVAHHVNNPLSAVKVNVSWMAGEGARPEHDAERGEVVAESLAAIDRIAGIVHDLKRRAVEQGAELERSEAGPGPAGGELDA